MSCEVVDLDPPQLNLKVKQASAKYFEWTSDEIQSRLPTDILLLTANVNEFDACLRYVGKDGPLFRSTKNGREFWFGQFGVEKRDNVKVVLIKTAMGPLEAQNAVMSVANMLEPKLVLSVGICATMKPEKADLGDVLIATKLIYHDLRKINENNKTEYRGSHPEVSRNMAKFIQTAAHGWEAPLKDPKSKEVTVHPAVMLTGGLLLNSADEKRKFADNFPDALGFEMEGGGVYHAARELGIEWGVIKAASDRADGTKAATDEWQKFGSEMAASVVHHMFKNPLVLKDWPHYKDAKGHTSSSFNCHDLPFEYWPRKELDEEIQKIRKGKIKVLHGTIGTGKTTAARNYIQKNKEKFDIRWRIDVSKGEDNINKSFEYEAERLGVSYDKLFQTIKERAERKDIIFLLDNVERKLFDESNWFQLLLDIRESVHIIFTTNSHPSDFDNLKDAEKFPVGKLDDALEFLTDGKGIPHGREEKDLTNLCDEFDSNILGLTFARDYMMKNMLTAGEYLERLRNSKDAREQKGTPGGHPTLYHSIRLCLLDVRDDDAIDAIATMSFISNNRIPEFLLSNQLSSNEKDYFENEARLDKIRDQLKSLVDITKEFGIRFYSVHPFTRLVIKDVVDEKGDGGGEKKDGGGEKKDGGGQKKDGDGEKTDEKKRSTKKDLLYKLAGTFVRYISKDNRFSKGHFLQRAVREHAEIFIEEWKEQEKDDCASIALARLSELVGFSYTQQQSLYVNVDRHFESARYLLDNLCEITEEDKSCKKTEEDIPNSNTNKDRDIFGITDKHLAVANQLFAKLTNKSSKLATDMIEELVFLRTVNEQDLAMFPEEVKEKITSSKPLSRSDVKELVNHNLAYSVDAYKKLFLPELYLSVIYSFGRNYFYRDRLPLKHPSVYYIDLLKVAYCLARAISEKMNPDEAVFHEHSVQSNGLLPLISEDGTHKKEREAHVEDLKHAITRYQELIREERRFFEMGILKKTKDDTYSQLKCYLQIVKCYKTLLSYTADEDHEQCIKDGVKACEDISKILQAYSALKSNADQTKEHLVYYSKHMNVIAEFYFSTKREKYIGEAIEIFESSAKQAEKYDDDATTMFALEALVGLAECFSEIGEFERSNHYLERCDSKESFREFRKQHPRIQKRIDNIGKHVKHRPDETTTSRNGTVVLKDEDVKGIVTQ